MWVCPNCGEELADKNVSFCGACGSRIAGAEEVEDVTDGYSFEEQPAEILFDTEDADDVPDGSEIPQDPPKAPNEFWYASDADDLSDEDEEDDQEQEELEEKLIPEDLQSLTRKIDDMIENGAFDAKGKEVVLLKCFSSSDEALVVKGLLDSEGIPAISSLGNLLVRDEDLEKAKEIIGDD